METANNILSIDSDIDFESIQESPRAKYNLFDIILNEGTNKSAFLGKLTSLTKSFSATIPNRAITIPTKDTKPFHDRFLSASLTDTEATALRNDSDVSVVEEYMEPDDSWLDNRTLTFKRFTDGEAGEYDNWGLWRHSNAVNAWTPTTDAAELTETFANTALGGYGVDVIIQELGMFNFNLPEYEDENFGSGTQVVPATLAGYNAGSRFVSFQWNTLSGFENEDTFTYEGTGMSSFSDHVQLTSSIVAGNRFGWANRSRIYSIPFSRGSGGTISSADTPLAIKAFHQWKEAQVAAGNLDYAVPGSSPAVVRPTVVNASWGYKDFIQSITRVGFRGNNFTKFTDFNVSNTDLDMSFPRANVAYPKTHQYDLIHDNQTPINKFGMTCQVRDYSKNAEGIYKYYIRHAFDKASEVATITHQEMSDAGVHYIKSAGNKRQLLDVPGGLDYDNYFWTLEGDPRNWDPEPKYYNRGSGNMSNTTIVVGNMRARVGPYNRPLSETEYRMGIMGEHSGEKLDQGSCRGPRVDISAAGQDIHAVSTSGGYAVGGGTSFSTPQVAGMVACLLAKYPTTTPAQMRTFVRSNASFHGTENLWGTGGTLADPDANTVLGDITLFGNLETLYGASGNIAYLNSAMPDDPSELDSSALAADAIDYIGHSHTPSDVADDAKGTYDLTGMPGSRYGTSKSFRYYKLVFYVDYLRTEYFGPNTLVSPPARANSTHEGDFLVHTSYDRDYSGISKSFHQVLKGPIRFYDRLGHDLFADVSALQGPGDHLGSQAYIDRDDEVEFWNVDSDNSFKEVGYVSASRDIFYPWEPSSTPGLAPGTYTVKVSADTKRYRNYGAAHSANDGYQPLIPIDTGVDTYGHPELGTQGVQDTIGRTTYGPWGPFYPVTERVGRVIFRANAEMTIDFGRAVFVANIHMSTHQGYPGNPGPEHAAKYIDIYGSTVPFPASEEGKGVPSVGEKIGEINRGDIYLHTYLPNDADTVFLDRGVHTAKGFYHNQGDGTSTFYYPANGYVDAFVERPFVQFPEGGFDPTPDEYGTWDPHTSQSGWYKIPDEVINQAMKLGQTFTGNAYISNTTQTSYI